ncbi:DUF1349 domain-containing protein [Paenibacillus sp. N3.4]|uniref:DUF1349 domain-containing protein n=1 Tax=Paenibacillus sp. N3.4 TaxID=2603222 RepID=UPI0011CBF308|nr:DUF1349 domain-containing protein [Paenibacillus sp. N3.4]TXK68918.1 DUF1349 domain-containing protein [Paenibacillus sp. N3.4]
MMMQHIQKGSTSVHPFYWVNEPQSYTYDSNKILTIQTEPQTDFWQKTSYGFQRDNGHSFLTKVDHDFTLTAYFEFTPKMTYDQCGLLVRLDEENWIKVSTEFENAEFSRMGSVVTNMGYSDWASTDISSNMTAIFYQIRKRGQDFLMEYSYDGQIWSQMRIAHLHIDAKVLSVGVYACSPGDSSFTCRISQITIGENKQSFHSEGENNDEN